MEMSELPIQIENTDHSKAAVIPVELSNLDDSTLVYSSEEGEHDLDSPKPVTAHGECCLGQGNGYESESDTYVEVIFKGERRGYYRNTTGVELYPEQFVIVETEKGMDLGRVGSLGNAAYGKSRLRLRPCVEEVMKILRLAEQSDMKVLWYHREQEQTAFHICFEKILNLNLPMKLVDVEFQFDRNRITFYFTADGRVDFRELVRQLAMEYRTRIELRQIGPRDEAKRLGGYGVCGRELCCSSWLGAFEPISTDMAKLQNLSLNPFKLAGQCGRLKCCLAYETHVYEELLHRFPPLDYRFQTAKGTARIDKIDVFQDAVFIQYEKSGDWERLTLEQVKKLIPDFDSQPA